MTTNRALLIALGEYPPFLGGIANFAASTTAALARLNYQVTVLAAYNPKHQDSTAFRVIRPRLGHRAGLENFLGQAIVFFTNLWLRPGLILICDPLSLRLSQFLLQFKSRLFPQTKISLLLHGTEILDFKAGTGLLPPAQFAKTAQKIDLLIVNSNYTANLLQEDFPKTKGPKIKILYPTIPETFLNIRLTPDQEDRILKRFNLAQCHYLLSIGRLVKRKGHEKILEIWPKIASQYPNLKYAVIGAGPKKETLLKRARKSNLGQKLVLTGEVSELEKKVLLKNCLIYLHPSIATQEANQRVEGFGIAVLEAFSQQKTALAFDHGGLPEIISHNQTGLLVKTGDMITFWEALARLIADPKLRSRLERNAAESFKTRFSPSRFQQNLQVIIDI